MRRVDQSEIDGIAGMMTEDISSNNGLTEEALPPTPPKYDYDRSRERSKSRRIWEEVNNRETIETYGPPPRMQPNEFRKAISGLTKSVPGMKIYTPPPPPVYKHTPQPTPTPAAPVSESRGINIGFGRKLNLSK